MRATVGWHVEMEFLEGDQHARAVAMVRLPNGSEVRAHGRATATSHASGRRSRARGPLDELAMRLLTKASDGHAEQFRAFPCQPAPHGQANQETTISQRY